jgi:cellulose biosynthesis protein BcsE
MRFLSPRTTLPCGLGIDALPLGLGQLPTGRPVALALLDGATDRLWLQALLEDLLQAGPVFVLAQTQARADALMRHAPLALAQQQGRLRLWLMGEDLAYARRPQGLRPLLDELRLAELGPDHALLVLAAPAVHLGTSVAAVQQWGNQWARWSRGRRRPVVMVFEQWQQADEVLAPLRSLAAQFPHVALLGSEARQTLLFVERWDSSEGPVFEARFGLRHDVPSQRLVYDGSRLDGSRSSAAQRLVEAPDQYNVLTTRAAVEGQRGIPPDWQVLEQLSDMAAATAQAIAATVLLDAGPTSQQQALLQLVYQLRTTHGRGLKIVVRETRDKLRSNLEQALLSLGANAVVYREVGFSRLQKLLEDLRDETFVRAIPSDFAQVLSGYMPDAVQGYLDATAFCDSVEAMLARTSQMGLRHCFLRLTVQTHVAHLDAIQACTAVRAGDVISADARALYVFMFACSEADLEPALGRLFSIPPSELFAAQTLYTTVDGMRSALRGLREAAHQGVPDYSAYRKAALAPAPPQAGQAVLPASLPAAPEADRASPTGLPVASDAPEDSPAPAPSVHARPLRRRNAAPNQGADAC